MPASDHDNWLIESLANYSALLLLERRKGVKVWTPCWTIIGASAQQDRGRAAASSRPDRSSGAIGWSRRWRPMRGGPLLMKKEPGLSTCCAAGWAMKSFSRCCARLASQSSFHQHRRISRSREPVRAEIARSGSEDIFRQLGVWHRHPGGEVVVRMARAGNCPGSIGQRDVDDAFTAYVPVEVQTGRRSATSIGCRRGRRAAFSIPS